MLVLIFMAQNVDGACRTRLSRKQRTLSRPEGKGIALAPIRGVSSRRAPWLVRAREARGRRIEPRSVRERGCSCCCRPELAPTPLGSALRGTGTSTVGPCPRLAEREPLTRARRLPAGRDRRRTRSSADRGACACLPARSRALLPLRVTSQSEVESDVKGVGDRPSPRRPRRRRGASLRGHCVCVCMNA
jgi:hypothetical protein